MSSPSNFVIPDPSDVDYDAATRDLVTYSANALRGFILHLKLHLPPREGRRKSNIAALLVESFRRDYDLIFRTAVPDLAALRAADPRCPSADDVSEPLTRSRYLHILYTREFLSIVFKHVRSTVPCHSCAVFGMPWLSVPIRVQIANVSNLPLPTLMRACSPLSLSLTGSRTRPVISSRLVDHFRARCTLLETMQQDEIVSDFTLSQPVTEVPPDREGLLCALLVSEYSLDVFNELCRPEVLSLQERRSVRKREQLKFNEELSARTAAERRADWPNKVRDEDILSSCRDYYEATKWSKPPMCASCARRRYGIQLRHVLTAPGEQPPRNLEILRLTDPFIIQNCIVKQNSNEFLFYDASIDGLMLAKAGLERLPDGTTRIFLCPDCDGSLSREMVPRYALCNNLYRGRLPEEFHDLTWVEEMVCSLYRNTAHVTRLYQSSDPAQPRVFHGNTCAHEMNVLSTASILPRTPSDLRGMLSIVFVGPGKFDAKKLGEVFHVRKEKVWSFLLWLKHHNRLYQNIPLDRKLMDLYPERGMVPGLEETVVRDNESDPKILFEEETAGFSEHPAQAVLENAADDSPVFIERMGVSDPEGDRISGRKFTAAALRNIAESTGSQLPDVVVHHGPAVSEYKNPSLFPGMFPTLYPFGIGGFDDESRSSLLSFQSQANYCFDIDDRCFRYHNSFMFVALNIIQRRAAHLHTYFTIRKTHFDSVAKKLVSLSAGLIASVASHLEREGKYADLTDEQKGALDLLKHVNTIAARIPGSQASKMFVCSEIRNYIGLFGLPHIYLTMNPNAVHSPIFQLMFGDEEVDLASRFPQLVAWSERARRLAKDPVAAADFFDFCIHSFLKHLLGWDDERALSTERGGLLGHMYGAYTG